MANSPNLTVAETSSAGNRPMLASVPPSLLVATHIAPNVNNLLEVLTKNLDVVIPNYVQDSPYTSAMIVSTSSGVTIGPLAMEDTDEEKRMFLPSAAQSLFMKEWESESSARSGTGGSEASRKVPIQDGSLTACTKPEALDTGPDRPLYTSSDKDSCILGTVWIETNVRSELASALDADRAIRSDRQHLASVPPSLLSSHVPDASTRTSSHYVGHDQISSDHIPMGESSNRGGKKPQQIEQEGQKQAGWPEPIRATRLEGEQAAPLQGNDIARWFLPGVPPALYIDTVSTVMLKPVATATTTDVTERKPKTKDELDVLQIKGGRDREHLEVRSEYSGPSICRQSTPPADDQIDTPRDSSRTILELVSQRDTTPQMEQDIFPSTTTTELLTADGDMEDGIPKEATADIQDDSPMDVDLPDDTGSEGLATGQSNVQQIVERYMLPSVGQDLRCVPAIYQVDDGDLIEALRQEIELEEDGSQMTKVEIDVFDSTSSAFSPNTSVLEFSSDHVRRAIGLAGEAMGQPRELSFSESTLEQLPTGFERLNSSLPVTTDILRRTSAREYLASVKPTLECYRQIFSASRTIRYDSSRSTALGACTLGDISGAGSHATDAIASVVRGDRPSVAPCLRNTPRGEGLESIETYSTHANTGHHADRKALELEAFMSSRNRYHDRTELPSVHQYLRYSLWPGDKAASATPIADKASRFITSTGRNSQPDRDMEHVVTRLHNTDPDPVGSPPLIGTHPSVITTCLSSPAEMDRPAKRRKTVHWPEELGDGSCLRETTVKSPQQYPGLTPLVIGERALPPRPRKPKRAAFKPPGMIRPASPSPVDELNVPLRSQSPVDLGSSSPLKRNAETARMTADARAMKKLKTPFKAPATLRIEKKGPDSARKIEDCYHATSSSSPASNSTEIGSSPTPAPSKRLMTKRLANACRTPAINLSLRLDARRQCTGPSDAVPQSKAVEIAALERHLQMLRQAVKFADCPEEDDKLRELVSQWRNAGRDVVEKLFSMVPEPEDPREEENSSSGYSTISAYQSGFRSCITEQIDAAIRQQGAESLPQDEEGNLVDEDGAPLDLPDLADLHRGSTRRTHSGPQEELDQLLADLHDDEPERDSSRAIQQQHQYKHREHAIKAPWDYAALMRSMQVDPDLFGYDAEEMDWCPM